MTTFDKRKESQENKFAHDSELNFKITARRNRLFGEWVAAELKKKPEEVEAYAKEVVESDFEKPGDEDVIEKVQADFKAAGIDVDVRDLREKFEEISLVARKQIVSGNAE